MALHSISKQKIRTEGFIDSSSYGSSVELRMEKWVNKPAFKFKLQNLTQRKRSYK